MDFDLDFYEAEKLHERATRELVSRHEEEYHALVDEHTGARVAELERQVARLLQDIAALKALNPGGVNAPALTETTQILVDANAQHEQTIRELAAKVAAAEEKNQKLREALK